MIVLENDRRQEPRALTAALIQVVDGFDDTSMCVLEDLSASGACLHSDIPLEPGGEVTLKVASVVHTGVVKRCQRAPGGFSVGIEFTNGPWPEPIGLPVHWIPPSGDL